MGGINECYPSVKKSWKQYASINWLLNCENAGPSQVMLRMVLCVDSVRQGAGHNGKTYTRDAFAEVLRALELGVAGVAGVAAPPEWRA